MDTSLADQYCQETSVSMHITWDASETLKQKFK